MKNRIFASLMLACLPWLAVAQSNDDLYFVPQKEKKAEKKQKAVVAPKQVSNTTVYASPGSTVVVKDASGRTRDIDEYNRRYTSRDNTFSMKNDTLYVEEKPYGERGEWVNGFEGSQDDYQYAMRIIRFRNPAYAIPVSSPLYWDVVYGAYPSWNWNVYDDGLYAYIFPTYSNPLWWDWRWNWGFYGPRWGFSFSWGSPWHYGGWYSSYWHGGYWGGYWSGYWGPGWHHPHPYPYHGWGSPARSAYRPSRYGNYSSSRRTGTAGIRAGASSVRGGGAYSGSRRTSSSGRVVRPNSSRGGASSVRPGAGSGINRGNAAASTRRPSSVTRPSRGNTSTYVRPSSTIDRTGSSYNRPSSTRRSVNYNNSSRTRNSYTSPSRSGSSRSGISSGGGGYHRSSGGSARTGGGSSRRR